MRHLKKVASLLLLIALVGTMAPVNIALAAETESGEAAQLQDNETKETENSQASKETEAPEEEAENTKELSLPEGLINYVGVDQPYLASPDTQKIAVSYGDGTENITSAKITYQKDDGRVYEDSLTERQEDLFLFEHTFSNEDKGTYTLLHFVYTEDGVEQTIVFSETGIQAMFGVDEEYLGYGASSEEISEEDIEVSVVEVEANNLDEAETTIEETIDNTAESVRESSTMSMRRAAALKENDELVVVLDPGHGGSDSGACGNGLQEKDINLKIAQYCKAELEEYSGLTVYMTRETDVYLGNKPSDAASDLANRVNKAKDWNADLMVSIHINSGGGQGVEVWYPNSNYNTAVGSQGKDAAQQIQDELVKLGLTNRGIKVRTATNDKYPDGSLEDYYGIIRRSKLAGFPGIIVEHAFIDNASDAAKLKDEAFLKSCGIADATGIANYFGLSKGEKGEWKSDSNGFWYEYADGSRPKDGWKKIGGYWYYFDAEGYRKTGWLVAGSKTYYLDEEGRMLVGWKEIDGSWYWFEDSGAMHTGWIALKGKWYYLNADGKMAVGFFNDGAKRYYADTSGALVMGAGWNEIDNVWYYMEKSGALHTDWLSSKGKWYYLNADGKMATGFVTVRGKTYYLNGSGAMLTGWQKISDVWYYFDGSGAMRTGWLKSKNKWYYLNADGKMATGFVTVQGKTYYLNESGAMLTGWQKISDVWYYFDGSGAMRTDWIASKGKWYYLNADGKMATGFVTVREKTYYLNGSGAMLTGWQKINDVWYYFDGSGAMRTGWVASKGKWYYLQSNGVMATEWIDIPSGKYYLNPAKNEYGPEGAMTVGWRMIDGTYYYFKKGRDPEGALYYTGVTSIMGKSDLGTDKLTVINKMVAMYKSSGRVYPADALNNGGAKDIETFCRLLYEEADAENVKPEVVFAQVMKETGYLKFGGDVKITQFNFGGLGATGGGKPGESFKDVATGLRAQVQHLKAYASNDTLNKECIDKRFTYVTRGSAPYVEWLGIQENPAPSCGWAAAQNYGFSLVNDYIKPIYSM